MDKHSATDNTNLFIYDDRVSWEPVAAGVQRKIMSYDKNLMLVKVEFETGSIGAIHQHYHVQISHVYSGSFEVEIAGEKRVLKTGDVFYVPSNILHGVVCLEAGILLDIFNPMREDFVAEGLPGK